jgi:tRNA U54 and U55 pseudouridine synthase Pus10
VVIELLKFRVASDRPKKFIHIDAEIWTQALATYSEFDGSEVWRRFQKTYRSNYDNPIGDKITVEVYFA